jgi:hypothetical protein
VASASIWPSISTGFVPGNSTETVRLERRADRHRAGVTNVTLALRMLNNSGGDGL